MQPHPHSALGDWLALRRALPSSLILELLQHFPTPTAILRADRAMLRAYLPDEKARRVQAASDAPAPDDESAWLAQPNNHLVTWLDADYPPLLREIADPPATLFVSGDRSCLCRPQLAIVGSRNPTAGGVQNARAFAAHLADVGYTITSGLALGVDAAAHRGALEAGGTTIAVTGNGLDRVYPRQHHALAHEIVARGALVSEFAPGTPPRREHFPQRNRLISGMSQGVLVVEAAVKSGSLITARLAAEQGREVFAIPGSIHSPLARGCHRLIRQGAKLVETAQDILEELQPFAVAEPRGNGTVTASGGPMDQLLPHLGYDPVDVDTLVDRSGLTADAVSSMLLSMELRGLVEAQPGGRYLRTS
jgi:DNA processing protein